MLEGTMPKPKKQRGRPVEHHRPERIDASPEEIAEVVLRATPKQAWRFEEARKRLSQSVTGTARGQISESELC